MNQLQILLQMQVQPLYLFIGFLIVGKSMQTLFITTILLGRSGDVLQSTGNDNIVLNMLKKEAQVEVVAFFNVFKLQPVIITDLDSRQHYCSLQKTYASNKCYGTTQLTNLSNYTEDIYCNGSRTDAKSLRTEYTKSLFLSEPVPGPIALKIPTQHSNGVQYTSCWDYALITVEMKHVAYILTTS